MRHIFTCLSFLTVRSAQNTLQVVGALQFPHVVDTDLLPTIVIGGPAQNTHITPVTRFISIRQCILIKKTRNNKTFSVGLEILLLLRKTDVDLP